VAISLLLGLAIPWIFVKGMRFNLVNTSYRNVSFGFRTDLKEAYITYFKATLATILTLGLAYPWAVYLYYKFIVCHARFGKEQFTEQYKVSSFFFHIFTPAAIALGPLHSFHSPAKL
jgi:uncharacterized membrane protein YjgN (DUF898 family)